MSYDELVKATLDSEAGSSLMVVHLRGSHTLRPKIRREEREVEVSMAPKLRALELALDP